MRGFLEKEVTKFIQNLCIIKFKKTSEYYPIFVYTYPISCLKPINIIRIRAENKIRKR